MVIEDNHLVSATPLPTLGMRYSFARRRSTNISPGRHAPVVKAYAYTVEPTRSLEEENFRTPQHHVSHAL